MGAPLSIPRRPISVADYHKMIDAGVFHEDDRVELIEGELIQMAPMGGAHRQLQSAQSDAGAAIRRRRCGFTAKSGCVSPSRIQLAAR